jgi:NAD(P)-dependent dehydrogenase (short-subunit alcohol dehydrogenase family)
MQTDATLTEVKNSKCMKSNIVKCSTQGLSMYNSLNGKIAAITGAATGIGRAIAIRLAQEGADIAIIDVNETDAAKTAALVSEVGRRAKVLRGDVGDYAQVKSAFDEIAKLFGGIDIAVNNAGIIRIGTIAELAPEDFRETFRVNVDGVFHCCKAIVPHLVRRGAGKIVNTASWLGKVGTASNGAYAASKFAVIGLTQALAMEVAQHRITVNAVCPGIIVDTGMRDEVDRAAVKHGLPTTKQREFLIPLGRVGLPGDVARTVTFLVSDQADYMTGQAINVTGGLCVQ